MATEKEGCSVPWAFALSALSVIVLVAAVQLVYAAMQLSNNHSWKKEWSDWQAHKALTAPERQDAALAAEQVQNIVSRSNSGQGVLATRLVGSSSTGALQPTSDIDVRVSARDCEAQNSIARSLENAGYEFVRAHATYLLYRGKSPAGKKVDVAVDTAPPLSAPSARELDNRGFLEFVLRRTHPSITVRQVTTTSPATSSTYYHDDVPAPSR
jgi:hypothetical protein